MAAPDAPTSLPFTGDPEADALLAADPDRLHRLVSRRVPLSAWRDAYTRDPDVVKPVLEFAS